MRLRLSSIFPSHSPDIALPVVFLFCASKVFAICSGTSPSRAMARQKNMDPSVSFCGICVPLFISSAQRTSVYYLCRSGVECSSCLWS